MEGIHVSIEGGGASCFSDGSASFLNGGHPIGGNWFWWGGGDCKKL